MIKRASGAWLRYADAWRGWNVDRYGSVTDTRLTVDFAQSAHADLSSRRVRARFGAWRATCILDEAGGTSC